MIENPLAFDSPRNGYIKSHLVACVLERAGAQYLSLSEHKPTRLLLLLLFPSRREIAPTLRSTGCAQLLEKDSKDAPRTAGD